MWMIWFRKAFRFIPSLKGSSAIVFTCTNSKPLSWVAKGKSLLWPRELAQVSRAPLWQPFSTMCCRTKRLARIRPLPSSSTPWMRSSTRSARSYRNTKSTMRKKLAKYVRLPSIAILDRKARVLGNRFKRHRPISSSPTTWCSNFWWPEQVKRRISGSASWIIWGSSFLMSCTLIVVCKVAMWPSWLEESRHWPRIRCCALAPRPPWLPTRFWANMNRERKWLRLQAASLARRLLLNRWLTKRWQ